MTLKQSTNKVFMVEPVNFGFNKETAKNNAFQQEGYNEDAQKKALLEFNAYRDLLLNNNVDVVSVKDSKLPETPDSIFPNNWFSTHQNKALVLYPMYAKNRRKERDINFINQIQDICKTSLTIDFTKYENENLYLEGTGSMVLDRINNIVYACLSPRTSEKVLNEFCAKMNYNAITFDAFDNNNVRIYHTNVLMCIGTHFAIICPDTIKDRNQKQRVLYSLDKQHKEIIEISNNQMNSFAGNVLEVCNKNDEHLIIMSDTAFNSLSRTQINKLNTYGKILHPDLKYIEKNGGGSARCMLAELY